MRIARVLLLLLSAAALGAGCLLWSFRHGPLRATDDQLLSRALRLLPPPAYEDSPLVYVKIQDVRDLPWPWPPLDYAILTHSILAFFPKTVAWEVLPPAPATGEELVYHKQWLRQLERLNQVIVPLVLHDDEGRGTVPDPARTLAVVGDVSRLPAWTRIQNEPSPAETAAGGAVNLTALQDGPLLRVPLLFRCGDAIIPSLACRRWHISAMPIGLLRRHPRPPSAPAQQLGQSRRRNSHRRLRRPAPAPVARTTFLAGGRILFGHPGGGEPPRGRRPRTGHGHVPQCVGAHRPQP
ncbi:MAG: CHASE2 domain-containing protein [Bdellovibrionaceae bacterium]|nr:CHASE2 domain-containing protein [Pseudobdellovibrionaceae bacterium]